MKKRLSLILAALMLASVCTSCAESENASEDNPAAASESTEVSEEAAVVEEEAEVSRADVPDNLPDKKYDGRSFTILTRPTFVKDFMPEEITGEALNDAEFERNLKIADRFDVTLAEHNAPSNWGDATWNNNLTSSVMAGDGAYDIVAGYAATIPEIIPKEILLDWKKIPYVDLTQKWWSTTGIADLTVNDKLFLLAGDYAVSLWSYMTCCLFNKSLVDQYQLGDMYEMVRENHWTLDKVKEIGDIVSTDMDGNGTYDGSDRYALISDNATGIDSFQMSTRIAVVSHTDDGGLAFTLNSERAMSVVEKVVNLYNADHAAYSLGDCNTMFRTQLAIFHATCVSTTTTLRDMEDDFGILPYPMLDEEQESYSSTVIDSFDLFVLPIDVKDQEFSGIITEAMCAENWRSVVPVYYDVVLKNKNSRDEESAEMLDIIRDTISFDYGYLCSSSLNTVGHIFVNLVRANSTDLASKCKTNEKVVGKLLQKMLIPYGIE